MDAVALDEVPNMDSLSDVVRWYQEQLSVMIELEIEEKVNHLSKIQYAPSTANLLLSPPPGPPPLYVRPPTVYRASG